MAQIDSNNLIKPGARRGPTVNGIKPILRATTSQKTEILKLIKKGWKDLIKLSFKAESGIGANNKLIAWKPLSEQYEDFKKSKGLLGGILEASSPNLSTRYQNAIKYVAKDFRIYIAFPQLVTGAQRRNPQPVDAGIHQLGQIQRRLVKKTFTTVANNIIIKYFTK